MLPISNSHYGKINLTEPLEGQLHPLWVRLALYFFHKDGGKMDWLLQIGKEYGLFVMLVAYVLWDGRGREARYINIIDKLSDAFEELKRDVATIKDRLFK